MRRRRRRPKRRERSVRKRAYMPPETTPKTPSLRDANGIVEGLTISQSATFFNRRPPRPGCIMPPGNNRSRPLRYSTNYARRSRACPEQSVSGRADHFCAPRPHSAVQEEGDGRRLRVPPLRLPERGRHPRAAGRSLRSHAQPQHPHPARGAAADVRPPPSAGGQVLARQHLSARREPLPVLREEVLLVRAVSRPRRAHLARRQVELGERRLRLPAVQRAQGQQAARRVRAAADPRPAPPALAPAPSPAGKELPRHLEELPGRGVLERGAEVVVAGSRGRGVARRSTARPRDLATP